MSQRVRRQRPSAVVAKPLEIGVETGVGPEDLAACVVVAVGATHEVGVRQAAVDEPLGRVARHQDPIAHGVVQALQPPVAGGRRQRAGDRRRDEHTGGHQGPARRSPERDGHGDDARDHDRDQRVGIAYEDEERADSRQPEHPGPRPPARDDERGGQEQCHQRE